MKGINVDSFTEKRTADELELHPRRIQKCGARIVITVEGNPDSLLGQLVPVGRPYGGCIFYQSVKQP